MRNQEAVLNSCPQNPNVPAHRTHSFMLLSVLAIVLKFALLQILIFY